MGSENKAYFMIEGEDQRLSVQFNPEEYKILQRADYSETSRKENGMSYVEFSGTVVPVLEISFFFDTAGIEDAKEGGVKDRDVLKLVNKFSDLVNIKAELHRPPIVKFIWGSTVFAGFVKSVSTTYTMFAASGMPVRAKIEASLMGVSDNDASKIPLESPDRTKSRIISEKSNIWAVAKKEYDDISKWRIIARENMIMDPFDLPFGTVIKVPALKP